MQGPVARLLSSVRFLSGMAPVQTGGPPTKYFGLFPLAEGAVGAEVGV